ncbi:MAG: glycosyltransferase [Patescibacteria group bacterium]
MPSNSKVALAHDHLNQFGGAEKVLAEFHIIYPEAPVFTLIFNQDTVGKMFDCWDIRTSFIQKLPGSPKLFKWYLGLMPAAVEDLDLSEYGLVISSCSALIKGLVLKPESIHLCYCHSPTRYLWSDTHQYKEELEQPRLIKKLLPMVLTKLRVWDQLAAQRVDHFIANSQFVAHRIKRYYRRPATVIYPPVDVKQFTISDKIEDYFLVISRLRPYKRVDLAVKAFNKLGIPLKIIGVGEQYNDLKKIARDNIEFLGQATESEKVYYLSRCKALIFPQEEDFGITAVEALSSGRPVIAYGKGGALEIIQPGSTGVFFNEQSWEALADAVVRFDQKKYDPVKLRRVAEKFDSTVFKERLNEFVVKVQKR